MFHIEWVLTVFPGQVFFFNFSPVCLCLPSLYGGRTDGVNEWMILWTTTGFNLNPLPANGISSQALPQEVWRDPCWVISRDSRPERWSPGELHCTALLVYKVGYVCCGLEIRYIIMYKYVPHCTYTAGVCICTQFQQAVTCFILSCFDIIPTILLPLCAYFFFCRSEQNTTHSLGETLGETLTP